MVKIYIFLKKQYYFTEFVPEPYLMKASDATKLELMHYNYDEYSMLYLTVE